MSTQHTRAEVDPRGPVDSLATINEAAVRQGLIRAGEVLPSNLLNFAADLIDQAATVGQEYGNAESGGNAGEHIRAVLYPF